MLGAEEIVVKTFGLQACQLKHLLGKRGKVVHR